VLTSLLSAAARDRLIGTSPAVGIVLPRKPHVELELPGPEVVRALLDSMPDAYRIAGQLAAFAGLRQGEVLGLTVDRIDFLRRSLRVDRQMLTTTGEPHFGPPKSDASVRTVPLPDGLLAALSKHIAAFTPGSDGLLVTYVDGRPVRRNRFGAMWRQSQARAGVTFRFHGLRHYFASTLIAGGCSIKEVQRVMGIASAKVALDTYGHLVPDSEDRTRGAAHAAWCALGVSSAPLSKPKGAGHTA